MHTIVFEHSIEYVENARASRPRDAAVSNLFRYRLWQTLCSKKISFAYIHRQHRVSICVIFFAYDTDVLCSLGALTHRSTIPLKHLNHTEVWKYFAFCLYWWKKHTNSTDHRILRKQKKTPSLKQNNKSKQNIRTQFTQAQIKNAWSTRDLLDICQFCSSTWMRVSLME